MKPAKRRKEGRGGLELIEESIHLLRVNAGAALAAYYVGSLPFVLGLLFFWADMSRNPYAAQHLTGTALGMALLFLWMKFWQAIFADKLRSKISASPPTRWNLRRALRVLIVQSAIQPSAVFVLPLALLPAGLPLPWAYAFYQNVTALTDGETSEIRKPLARAWQQMKLWPGQNHVILAVLAGFALAVLLNLATVCYYLPHLLKMLLGFESVYTRSGGSLFNTTFLAAICSLTYLCVDPIVKGVYLLRCFYGESLESGEDLKAELRNFAIQARGVAAILMLVLSLVCAGQLHAADDSPPAPPATAPSGSAGSKNISAPALDKAINDVIHHPKYTWRMPREKVVMDDTHENALVRFINSALRTLGRWFRNAVRWIIDLLNKLFRHTPSQPGSSSSGNGWMSGLQTFFFILLAAVVSLLVILLLRAWQRRQRQPAAVASEALAPAPDLTDENVGADQLPEDGWIKLGRELLGRGEFRLALRAFYFASLTHLAARNLLTIAKFKSNRDYERELGRRGHSLPNLLPLFGENVLVFDRSWYGLHEVNQETVGRFLTNVERIKEV